MAKKGRAPSATSELKPSSADASNGADASSGAEASQRQRFRNKAYLLELARLQLELVKLQEWIRQQGLRVVVVFDVLRATTTMAGPADDVITGATVVLPCPVLR